jgi:hypothetical protein
MDPAVIRDVAEALWPMLISGGVQQLGARGADGIIEGGQELIERVRGVREKGGLDSEPLSVDELENDLRQLAREDSHAKTSIYNFGKAVYNTFEGPVDAHRAVFGFQEGQP